MAGGSRTRLSGFSLLMWKNLLLQRRHRVQTAIEVLSPVFFSVLLVVVRSLVLPVPFADPTLYPGFEAAALPELPAPLAASKMRWVVAWTPNHPILQKVMDRAAASAGFQGQVFSSEELLLGNLTAEGADRPQLPVLAGVVFEGDFSKPGLPAGITVKLRFPSVQTRVFGPAASWVTDQLFPPFQLPGPRSNRSTFGGPPDYTGKGFAALQHVLSTALIEQRLNRPLDVAVRLQRFPYPPFVFDPLLEALKGFAPLIFMLSFVYTCISAVSMVTVEKERQLKESMKIMGLANWLHWTAWFLNFMTLLGVSVALMTVLVKVDWYGKGLSVFTYSDGTVVFVFLLLFASTTVTFSFLVSTFFSKVSTAATVAQVAWILNYSPFFFFAETYDQLAISTKVLACLASNTGMAFGVQVMVRFEANGEGAQWSNLFSGPSLDDSFSLGAVMLMFVLDSVVYMLLALYIEAVFPGDFGVPRPWNFIFQKSFWLNEPQKDLTGEAKDCGTYCDSYFEEEPYHLPAGIKIKSLNKVFDKKKVAVSSLNLNMYEGQITVLLGHNGAGKTTTMSMLTGMLTPTKGTALVGGHDIRFDMQGVRESLGLCPQHNILFDELTVKEHLQFYCKLKGLGPTEVQAEVAKYIKLLDFEAKTNSQSKTLSGGMQRKLSVGVALCGGSKVVLLDEPTSGMDPGTRRTLWDVLEAEKAGRTMLLTTHFMDEADLLGDRIAIMAGGQLQCCGSSFFLKKKYGTGYYLVIAKGKECDVAATTALLQRYIPEVHVGQNIGSELSYQLPEDRVSVFEPMMAELESSSQRLGVVSYGVSLTTMEEVFVKAGRDKEVSLEHAEHTEMVVADDNDTTSGAELTVIRDNTSVISGFEEDVTSRTKVNSSGLYTGAQLLWNQFCAMMLKKALSTKRSWILYCIQVALPLAFLIIVILVSRVRPGVNDFPPLTMTLASYLDPITVAELASDVQNVSAVFNAYHTVLKPTGFIINDVTKRDNMSSYLLKKGMADVVSYRGRYIAGATFDFDPDARKGVVTAWFSNQPYHAQPLSLNLVHNALMKHYLGPEHSLTVLNHPLPFSSESKVLRQLAGTMSKGFQYAFNISFGMTFVCAIYVLFYVRERNSKSKHLQIVSGVRGWMFWTSALLWDLATFLGPTLGLIITLAVFQEEGLCTTAELGRFFVVLMMFAWCFLPLVYLSSLLFKVPSSGFSRLTIFSTIFGVAPFMVVVVLQTPGLNLEDTSRMLEWIFMLFPHYNVTICIFNLYQTYLSVKICTPVLAFCPSLPARNQTNPCCREPVQCPGGTCLQWTGDYFAMDKTGIGRQMIFFAVEGALMLLLVILIEYRVFDDLIFNATQFITSVRRRGKPIESRVRLEPEDSDVLLEKQHIRSSDLDVLTDKYQVVLRDVTKYYGSFLAVDHLCLGVERGECFGLLGVNGAGKTTTFKMMTGDERISSGDAFLNGLNLTSDMKQVHQLIGYCPQFDALLDDLTGRETLTMFCLLRGVPWRECGEHVERLARQLLFSKHVDKRVKEYSGGNKRKLSMAVALIGDPMVLYLDEPTTGMDPVARRHFWNVVCQVRDLGKSVVLTSHSMEECEALCTRLAIMVNGEFKCLGSTQYLKSKFAEGYTLTLKVRQTVTQNATAGEEEFDTLPVKEFVAATFPGAVLKEEVQGMLSYYIPSPCLAWSRMFGLMEEAKRRLNVEDYSLGQTSLEQVFLSFRNSQRSTD